MKMNTVIFFTTKGCHLCELAGEILENLRETENFSIEVQDISETEILVEKYGLLIPVIMDKETCKELRWPFDNNDVMQWISSNDL
jgi:hypothetical protein